MLVPGHAQRAPTGILAIRTYRLNHLVVKNQDRLYATHKRQMSFDIHKRILAYMSR